MAYKILIVDDQKDICTLIAQVLHDEGYQTVIAHDSQAAIRLKQEEAPDVVILDIWLNDQRFDGIEVLDIMKQNDCEVPIIMISGHANIETAVASLHKGAFDFIEKPFNSERLLSIVSKAIEYRVLKRQIADLQKKTYIVNTLTGDSAIIKNLMKSITKIAPTNSRVLIEGRAGSGKEVVARIIHNHSTRAKGPFVVVNCANLDAKKLSEELFGVERNMGTPHAEIKAGFLEQANGGTLLLDNVADMPLDTQARIMQVLQEQRFTRVGGNRAIQVDVRLLSSTSKDLQQLIQTGKFREDLYYRLCVVPLRLPSLVDRPGDIPLLANTFLVQTARENGLQEKKLSRDAEVALQNYTWPGNVRQLRNMMEWVMIMVPQERQTVTADLLPRELTQLPSIDEPHTEQKTSLDTFLDMPLKQAREVFEREYIRSYINRHNGNIARTAQEIGMERTALHRKIKLLSLELKQTEEE